MNLKKYLIFIIPFLLLLPLDASEDLLIIKGKTGYPYFDREGILSLVFCDLERNVRLGKIPLRGIASLSPHELPMRGCAYSPRLKKDRTNQTWIIWEHRDSTQNDIYIAQITDKKIDKIKNISSEFEGINHSPSLDFSLENDPWAAWINYYCEQYILSVKNLNKHQTWVLSSSRIFPIFSPQILADGSGKIWVFWVGQKKGLDEIMYSCFDGISWAEPAILSSNTSVPHFHPSVSTDLQGNPWVVWSAYDGEDYEIYVTSWQGSRWLAEEKITSNKELSDTQPFLSFFFHSIPAVVWTQAGKEKRDIYLAYKNETGWSSALNVSCDNERSGFPIIISEEDRIAILWLANDQIFLKRLSFFQLQTEKKRRVIKAEVSIKSSSLSRNKFIAFGDSITYGWMNGPALEKGYVPRLQTLLKGIFVEPYVFNRGVPGEPTWEGLGRIVSVITADLALYLLLMEGTNDVITADYSMNTTAFNLRQMVTKCHQYSVFPLISTIIPRTDRRWTMWDGYFRQRIFNLNEKISQISNDFGLLLVDNFESFYSYPEELGGWQSLIGDGVHPNEKGYQLMAEKWYGITRTIPFPPVDIKAVKKMRESSVYLSWEESSKIIPETKLSSYKIYRKKQDSNKYSLIATLDCAFRNFQDTSISILEDYDYALSSVNSNNIEGPLSDPVIPIYGDPFPPINIEVKKIVNKAFLYEEYINEITWDNNEKNQGLFTITKFRIYRKRKGEEDEKFLLIGEVKMPYHIFLDRHFSNFQEADSCIYGVSSVDENNNEGPIGKD